MTSSSVLSYPSKAFLLTSENWGDFQELRFMPDEKVFAIGNAQTSLVLCLEELVPSLSFFGIDSCEREVRHLRESFGNNLYRQFSDRTIEDLNEYEGSFDKIFCRNEELCFDPTEHRLSLLFSLLRPGGVLQILESNLSCDRYWPLQLEAELESENFVSVNTYWLPDDSKQALEIAGSSSRQVGNKFMIRAQHPL